MDLTERQIIDMLLAVMDDFCHESIDSLFSFLEHIDFDMSAVDSPKQLVAALPAHYRLGQGRYDVDRLGGDLVSWGPIARAIKIALREKGPVPPRLA